ncbi:hypothetical protein BV898_07342 [Hypsibius exemplaris]|uniref:Ig-like domain-containing protein n=1 Tax=Hypsibius exemplaris TaxID=2072580 RepID=A0A1W0WTH2_HYPEX|nr:hypothetical protein BV898_07342 [Hypsibius exemplaris]
MALFLATKMLVDTFALLPPSAGNNSGLYDHSLEWVNAPEILEFKFTPNPAVEGQNVNVTCVVRPTDSQVLITRIKGDDLDHSHDYSASYPNDTISIFGADHPGVLWGNVPYNKSGSYICEARNFKGLVRSRNVNLYLRHLPQSRIEVDLKTTLGMSMDIFFVHPAHCIVAADKDPIDYHWGYTPLGNSTAWIILPHKTMTINVSADSSGTYRCSGLTDIGWTDWSQSVLITPSSTSALTSDGRVRWSRSASASLMLFNFLLTFPAVFCTIP